MLLVPKTLFPFISFQNPQFMNLKCSDTRHLSTCGGHSYTRPHLTWLVLLLIQHHHFSFSSFFFFFFFFRSWWCSSGERESLRKSRKWTVRGHFGTFRNKRLFYQNISDQWLSPSDFLCSCFVRRQISWKRCLTAKVTKQNLYHWRQASSNEAKRDNTKMLYLSFLTSPSSSSSSCSLCLGFARGFDGVCCGGDETLTTRSVSHPADAWQTKNISH